MSMPPPPPPGSPQPPVYPGPSLGYGPPTPSYGYPQLPVGAPPTVSPSGVDATANVLGAVGGLVLTALGMGVMIHASTELSRRLSFLRGIQVVDVVVLAVGVAVLGSVVLTGRVAPAAPIVSGAMLVAVGLLAMFSDDFLSWTFRNYPIDGDAQGVAGWLAMGFTVVVGGLMIASGIASALGRRR